jgi:hypothetical protein
MCREDCSVRPEQAAETRAELRRTLDGKMYRIMEERIARNQDVRVDVNYVMRREQIADVCGVAQPPHRVAKLCAIGLVHGQFHRVNPLSLDNLNRFGTYSKLIIE